MRVRLVVEEEPRHQCRSERCLRTRPRRLPISCELSTSSRTRGSLLLIHINVTTIRSMMVNIQSRESYGCQLTLALALGCTRQQGRYDPHQQSERHQCRVTIESREVSEHWRHHHVSDHEHGCQGSILDRAQFVFLLDCWYRALDTLMF